MSHSMTKSTKWAHCFFMPTERTRIRLGRCPGWPETLLGAQVIFCHAVAQLWTNPRPLIHSFSFIWAASSDFVSSSILSWQILTAHAQPFRGARDLVFCLKVPLDSMLVWASSGGSGETARMRRLAWTFAARICDKYQIRLTRSILSLPDPLSRFQYPSSHWSHWRPRTLGRQGQSPVAGLQDNTPALTVPGG